MPIYEFDSEEIRPVTATTFSQARLRERQDLQRLLRTNISVITEEDILVLAEEFADWDESRRRIDLLGIDRDANLVVIELKRTEDGGHMELQALRYAAMVSAMTFDQAVDAFGAYLSQIGDGDTDARAELLDFLGWDEPDEDAFAQDVRIVLASAEFGRELTTAVLWLIERGIDIRCVRLEPYDLDGKVLVDVRQIIPLREAADYQVRVAKKKRREREARAGAGGPTRYDVTLGDRRLTGLPKRQAILHAFLHLVDSGIAPEKIVEQFGPRGNRALMSVDGEVAAEEFLRQAEETRAREGRGFDPTRFFCGENELVRFGGRTYAFTGEWGGTDWMQAMTSLRVAFPDQGIRFAPSEQVAPLHEAGDHQVRVGERTPREREARSSANDLTRYDVTLRGLRLTGLPKRQAIYRVFLHLVESGIAPEKVVEHSGLGLKRTLMSVDGEVTTEDFRRLATESRAREGRGFDPKRFFCTNDYLVRVNGRTYALSSQWPGPEWMQAMTKLRDAFPDQDIKFTPSE